MRKVFIDCGYYRGKAIGLFKKTPEYDESFEFFAFDANRMSDDQLEAIKNNNITFINKVVWTYDGAITFYASGRRHGQANSVFSNPAKPKREKKRNLECLDFGKWVKENFSKDDYIVLKMDIEGAEYDVLKKMLEDGSLNYVDIMYVEYHYDRGEVTREDFHNLRQKIKDETQVEERSAIEW